MADDNYLKCYVCSGDDLFGFKAFAHQDPSASLIDIVECRRCGLARQYPLRLTSDQSVRLFENEYRNKEGYFDDEFKLRSSNVQLDYIETLPLAGRRLLDVGGGSGAFAVAAASRGWDATVVDPALDPTALFSSGVRAFKGGTDQLAAGERFAVVTSWDVIEHVPDPRALIKSMKELLSPGGLLVLETGNYRSAARVMGGDHYWIYQHDHRWYFSPSNLAALLREQKLEVLSSARGALRPNWSGSPDYRGQNIRTLIKEIIRRPLNTMSAIRKHRTLSEARYWPDAGLEIFCVVAGTTSP